MTIFANTTKEELEAKIEAITHLRPKSFKVTKLENENSSLFQIELRLTINLTDILEFGIIRFNPSVTAKDDVVLITFIVPVV